MKYVTLKIKKLHKDAIIPAYQSPQSAGFDLHAIEDYELQAAQRMLISTGLAFEIESGFEIQVRPRSGLALKNGISVLNTPGTIDSDYRGEIKIILINHSNETFFIKKGDRIAQAVINEIYQAVFQEEVDLSDTERGSGGFGSSGVS